MSSPDININLDIVCGREPILYSGIGAIPDVLRLTVMRSLLEGALETPYDARALAAGAAAMAVASEPDPDARIFKKLTFRADRPEDHALLAHFTAISPGRRRKEARALLTKALIQADIDERAGHSGAARAPLRAPETVAAPRARQVHAAPAPAQPVRTRPGPPVPALELAPADLGGEDMSELFDVVSLKF